MDCNSVMYFNRGSKCIIRALVSMTSLRKHYDGPVYCVLEGEQEDFFLDRIKKLDIEPIQIKIISGLQSLCTKPHLYKFSRTDYTLYLDSDTLVCAPVDDFFDYIKKYDFVTTNFSNWKTDAGGMVTRRIKAWSKICSDKIIEDAIKYGQAVNTGINGWTPKAELLKHWAPLTEQGERKDCVRRMVDEIACQLLVPQYKSYVASNIWNTSVKYDRITRKTKIIHYHGNKSYYKDQYRACRIWYRNYKALVESGFIDVNECFADRRLRRIPWRKKLVDDYGKSFVY